MFHLFLSAETKLITPKKKKKKKKKTLNKRLSEWYLNVFNATVIALVSGSVIQRQPDVCEYADLFIYLFFSFHQGYK